MSSRFDKHNMGDHRTSDVRLTPIDKNNIYLNVNVIKTLFISIQEL